jgi:hypothetical protein
MPMILAGYQSLPRPQGGGVTPVCLRPVALLRRSSRADIRLGELPQIIGETIACRCAGVTFA